MRYIVAWGFLRRPVHSTSFVFEPSARLVAIAHPDQLSEEKAFAQTMAWYAAKTKSDSKVSVVTGVNSFNDPSNPDLPRGLECDNCHCTNTILGSIRLGKGKVPDVHTWHCMNMVNITRNSDFPCEGCLVCQHSVELWDHLYHFCDRMKAARLPPAFLRPNYEHRHLKNETCKLCGWGPTNVVCKCRLEQLRINN